MEGILKSPTGFNFEAFIDAFESITVQKFRMTRRQVYSKTKRKIAEALYRCLLLTKDTEPMDFDLRTFNYSVSLYLMGQEKFSAFIGQKNIIFSLNTWQKAKTVNLRKLLEKMVADCEELSMNEEFKKMFQK